MHGLDALPQFLLFDRGSPAKGDDMPAVRATACRQRCVPCSLLTCAALQVYPGSLSAPLLLAFVVRQLHRLGLVSDRHRLSRAMVESYPDFFLTQVSELGGAHERIVAAVRTLADRDRHEVT